MSVELVYIRSICVYKTSSRPTTRYNTCGRSPFFHPKKRIYCASACLYLNIDLDTTISAIIVIRRLLNSGFHAKGPVVCLSKNRRHRSTDLCWARKHQVGPTSNWLLYCSPISPCHDTERCRDSADMEGTIY